MPKRDELKLRSPMRFSEDDWALADLLARHIEQEHGISATRANAFRLALRKYAESVGVSLPEKKSKKSSH